MDCFFLYSWTIFVKRELSCRQSQLTDIISLGTNKFLPLFEDIFILISLQLQYQKVHLLIVSAAQISFYLVYPLICSLNSHPQLITIFCRLMRLAAEYQQRNKKQQQKQQNGRKYIVRLGKGVPQQQKRKRGISLSQGNCNLSQQSLGRNQISRQKQKEIEFRVPNPPISNKIAPEQKTTVSAARYCTIPQKINRYAAEHLLPVKQEQVKTMAGSTRYLSGVKSLEKQFCRQNNHITYQRNYVNPVEQIHVIHNNMERVVNNNVVRPFSRERQNFVEINSKIINNPSNIDAYERKQGSIQHPSSLVIPCGVPNKIKAPQPIIRFVKDVRSAQKYISIKNLQNTNDLIDTTRNTEKMISSQSKYDNFMNPNLKTTKKNNQFEKQPQELKQTKKYLRGVVESKEISNSSNVSGESRTNVAFSRANQISLWDANKVESIMSMKSSREIKVQQSEIMVDYFNPSESMMKKL